MQIMAEKASCGALRRTAGARLYPCHERDTAQRQMVCELVDRLFGGSSTANGSAGAEERPASAEELDESGALNCSAARGRCG